MFQASRAAAAACSAGVHVEGLQWVGHFGPRDNDWPLTDPRPSELARLHVIQG